MRDEPENLHRLAAGNAPFVGLVRARRARGILDLKRGKAAVAVLWECGNRAVCDFQGRRGGRGKLDVELGLPVTRDESFPRSLLLPSLPQRSLSSINWWLSWCGSVLAGPAWPSAFVGRPECRSFAAPVDPIAQD